MGDIEMNESVLKLQNIILPYDIDENIRRYKELMYRTDVLDRKMNLIYDIKKDCHIIKQYDSLDFMTYFNSLQIKKWNEYTNINAFQLRLIVQGVGTVELKSYCRNSKSVDCSIISYTSVCCEDKEEIVIDIPNINKELVGFSIVALNTFKIYAGYYVGLVEESKINDVQISLVMTTFKKEDFVKKNIEMLKKYVLNKGNDLADHFFVHIIDNGRTLNEYNDDEYHLKVYHNNNVGGSGGFTRGMIEAMQLSKKPTHILLMDDDVLIMCESLLRTYYLLCVVKNEYKDNFVSGAMFDYDLKEIQYEDIGYVHIQDGSYGPLKDKLDMRLPENLLMNEEMSQRKQENMYAGWWYCCIPTNVIEQKGLPLPLFVRGDDVEFSLRNQAKFITLNGICIWHVGFAGKFNAAMELYQVHRNSLIIQAASDICRNVDFMARLKPMFWKEITQFAYNNAELILDAIDDFLKGPDYLTKLNGEECLKKYAAKNDKLRAIEVFPMNYHIQSEDPYQYVRLNILQKLIYVVTINGHLIPGIFLKWKPGIIAYDWFFCPGRNYMRKKLIAVNPKDKTACERNIDRRKCLSLIKRYCATMNNYKKKHIVVETAYRDAFGRMTTVDFWKEYL